MLCSLPWKNLASRILKPTLIRSQKQPWTLKIKKHLTLPKPLSVSIWITLLINQRYSTMVQMNMPMMRPTPKVGTTSNGMDYITSSQTILTALLLWPKKEGYNQWPSTMASTMKTRMMLNSIRMS